MTKYKIYYQTKQRKYDSNSIKIAVVLYGGLGSNLISLDWMKKFYKYLKANINFDLYGNVQNLKFAASQIDYIKNIKPQSQFAACSGYDLKLKINYFIEPQSYCLQNIKNKSIELADSIEKMNEFNKKHKKYIQNKPHFDGGWINYCIKMGWNRYTSLDEYGIVPFSMNNVDYINIAPSALVTLMEHNLFNQPYITVHYGANKNYNADKHGGTPEASVKIWPRIHWEVFCRLFKAEYPNIKVVQLGSDLAIPIEGVDLSLCGKLSYMESAAALKYSLFHIDNESGLVTIKHMTGGKSIVLFGPTPAPFFGYNNNINIVSEFCGNCLWLPNTPWFTKCMRGFQPPECMVKILPETVMVAAKKLMDSISTDNIYHYYVENCELYSSAGLQRYKSIFFDICNTCNVDAETQENHIIGPARTLLLSSRQWEYPYIISKIKSLNTSELNIIDVGGSRGMLSWYLSSKYYDVAVYDINYKFFSSAVLDSGIEEQFLKFSRDKQFRVDFGSIFNLPIDNNAFDVAVCVSVLNDLEKHAYIFAIQELLRIVKPGGKIILTFQLTNSDNIEYDNKISITKEYLHDILGNMGINFVFDDYIINNSVRDAFNDKIRIENDTTICGMVIKKIHHNNKII
jgi:ADP-heptose:LPS heptosyltransferase/2-polyprenyl-3-methyl-5-hydroxy-6-metoxy-1,4-benzoquinol methylase